MGSLGSAGRGDGRVRYRRRAVPDRTASQVARCRPAEAGRGSLERMPRPAALRDARRPDREARRRAVREQRVRRALQGHRRRGHHRRRQRARAAARGVPGHRRAPGAHHPRPLGPHPGRRRRCATPGSTSASPPTTPTMLPALRLRDPRRRRDRGRRPPAAHDPHPGPHAGLHVLPARGPPDRCSAATRCSPAAPATPRFEGGDFDRSSSRSTAACSRSPPTRSCCPGHGLDTTIGTERPHLAGVGRPRLVTVPTRCCGRTTTAGAAAARSTSAATSADARSSRARSGPSAPCPHEIVRPDYVTTGAPGPHDRSRW